MDAMARAGLVKPPVWVSILALASWGAAGATFARPPQDAQPEYAIKARFLLQFPEFVAWPTESGLGDPIKPFVVLVLGTSPFEKNLDVMVGSRKVKGHPVKVVYSSDISNLDGCQMVFISASEKGHLKEILARIGSRPILTVGDSESFGKKGVMINLSIEEDLPRFEINVSAARFNGLGVSAQLLNLARKVW